MSFTMRLSPAARWRAAAESDSAQGADGVAALARTAYRNLCSAPWERDPAPASMPVHDYERARPAGQAYKAVWGYDRDARTQHSCAGAACYTFRVPASALDYTPTRDEEVEPGKTYYTRSGAGTPESPYAYTEVASPADAEITTYYEAPATVSAVSAEIAVDRYCDMGAVLYAEFSDDVNPPPFGSVAAIAQALGVAWYPTSAQVGADGSDAPAPNKRHADGGGATYAFATPAAPGKYLHVFLLMADYLGVRGDWIEGGAMFSAEAADVSFSRLVESSPADSRSAVTRMTVGLLDFDGTTTPENAIATMPRVSLWANWTVQPDADTFAALSDEGFYSAVENLLAYIYNSAGLYDGQTPEGSAASSSDSVAAATTAALSGTGRCKVSVSDNPNLGFAALVVHGMTARKTFRGLVLGSPLNPSSGGAAIPYRVSVYGISSLPEFPSSPRSATPVPWWGDIVSEAGRAGRLSSMRFLSAPASASGAITLPAQSSGATTAIPVQALASLEVGAETADIPFDRPFESGELSSLVVAVVPCGSPSATSSPTSYAATATRLVSATFPGTGLTGVSSAAIPRSATATGTCVVRLVSQYPAYHNVPGSILYLTTNGIVPNAQKSVSASGTAYRWQSHPTSISKTVSTKLAVELAFSVTLAGREYSYSGEVEFTTNVSWSCTNIQNLAGLLSGTESANLVGTTAAKSLSVRASGIDGSAITLSVTIPSVTLKTGSSGGGYSSEVTASDVSDLSPPFTPPAGYANSYILDWDGVGTTRSLSVSGQLGTAYTWSNSSTGDVSAAIRDSGTVSFERGGKTFSAALPERDVTVSATVYAKGAGVATVGIDTTMGCEVEVTVPARSAYLDFVAADGSRLRAMVAIPARTFRSDDSSPRNYVLCRDIATGTARVLANVSGEALDGAVVVAEAGAEQEIDLGVLSLYE